ncbi:alpha-methylacyl-CoA racemase [Jatrophihabitans sp. GAS493]|uniref:CaiB/BaiF CoA transferase family protein n=1 Tax=Jatrophihabitans sp. GAS493 TaxID=1907575 RepID=UPI000BBFF99C|nr:CaiB/BaiF CoA-transferase family protein [Jatrophihabitans sp. GAS493]SOD71761.1 alpha-methylacyl-CoA racemase [Jatrophihabitans sp. GAS493]
MPGPLAGVRVLELAGQGGVPFAGMALADMGAEVLRLERPSGRAVKLVPPQFDVVGRGRRSVAIDLKADGAADLVLQLVTTADVLLEGFRPGVTERLGLGPDECLAANPSLVYARVTGWGQRGPRALLGGHDINYIAVTGALAAIGERDRRPVPPLNLVGDFAGGGLSALVGILAALHSVTTGGAGQVVDVAMLDGVSSLLSTAYGYRSAGATSDDRESNFVDGGSPHYRTYECRDGGYVAVGAVEPVFFARLIETLGVDVDPSDQLDRSRWAAITEALAAAFMTRDRDEWAEIFGDVDACVTPVLSLVEAQQDRQVRARDILIERAGVIQPAPSPRFSATPSAAGLPPRVPGEDTVEALLDWGVPRERIDGLLAGGVLRDASAHRSDG